MKNIRITKLSSFDPTQNLFLQETYLMGTDIGSNIIIFHENHPGKKMEFMILCNKITGERIKINFDVEDVYPDIFECQDEIYKLGSTACGPGRAETMDQTNLFTWILRSHDAIRDRTK